MGYLHFFPDKNWYLFGEKNFTKQEQHMQDNRCHVHVQLMHCFTTIYSFGGQTKIVCAPFCWSTICFQPSIFQEVLCAATQNLGDTNLVVRELFVILFRIHIYQNICKNWSECTVGQEWITVFLFLSEQKLISFRHKILPKCYSNKTNWMSCTQCYPKALSFVYRYFQLTSNSAMQTKIIS